MRWLDSIIDSMNVGLSKLGVSEGQGSLVCCSAWGRKESDTTERLNNNNNNNNNNNKIYKPIRFISIYLFNRASQVTLVVKNLPANVRDTRDVGLIPGSGRSPGEGNGNPLQYSCLENPLDRGAWQAIVHGVAKSWTRLK